MSRIRQSPLQGRILISYIRWMLWVGAQRAREFFDFRVEVPRVVRTVERIFPDAVWGMRGEDAACITGDADRIRIILLNNSKN